MDLYCRRGSNECRAIRLPWLTDDTRGKDLGPNYLYESAVPSVCSCSQKVVGGSNTHDWSWLLALHDWLDTASLLEPGFLGQSHNDHKRSRKRFFLLKSQPLFMWIHRNEFSVTVEFRHRFSVSFSLSVNKPLTARPWCVRMYMVLLHRECTDPYLPIYRTCAHT